MALVLLLGSTVSPQDSISPTRPPREIPRMRGRGESAGRLGVHGSPWYLGVQGCNTIYGVEVNTVLRDTPASRIGLVPGDRIIEVDGNRVGIVNHRVNQLSDEFQHSKDGKVKLLIWNVRTQLEQYITVQLAKW